MTADTFIRLHTPQWCGIEAAQNGSMFRDLAATATAHMPGGAIRTLECDGVQRLFLSIVQYRGDGKGDIEGLLQRP